MLEAFKNNLNHVSVPPFLYGTAWKKEKTQMLTLQALENGFIGIDTANQLKHYFEEGVGLGIQQFLKNTGKSRSDLFLQTKFTPAHSQDHNKPYDETDSYKNQVRQSFLSSLDHLQTDYIDSYILHGPTYYSGLVRDDLDIWKAMEDLYDEGKVRLLGISNVDLEQLEALYNAAVIKPSLVQNRCFASSHWDSSIRLFCKKHGILYQGFSLLTANQSYLLTNTMYELAKHYKKSIPQIVFRFALQIGIVPLTGTSSQQHMKEDLDLDSFELSSASLKLIEDISRS
ncbi:aldo/keto reductase [Legionella anisa]|uniref:Aldo/keto reductase n=1 Tax=Legionella anisa TaxID=28082 RepID=A0AAX0WT98_9GAMM|nr:aldo/keto reductase [Legionella anisa]AWN74281.1 aldo/keto reductase [Legionella anisa]KTC72040.1 oxidoreductase,aldo/keto reductase family [Legionella anisa]MBN5934273.1 aldo/keto reductase [Legionella anisa]MCW8425683.1 aldo/keto reductase [Legionella anisa]MCW8448888.1 aldo/keto reductase [Legionella anisa]